MKKILTLIVITVMLMVGCATTAPQPHSKYKPGMCFALMFVPGKIIGYTNTELGPVYVAIIENEIRADLQVVVDMVSEPIDCPLEK